MTVNTVPPPVSAGGRVFVMSGFRGNALQAIDLVAAKGELSDSKAIAWRHDRNTPYVPSPVGATGRVYIAGRNGATVVIGDGEEFRVLATNRLDDSFTASPAVVGDAIFLRGLENLYCIAE